MKTTRAGVRPLTATLNLLLLTGAAAVTALEYPRVALSIHELLAHEGGDGSALGFVRDRYVFPAVAAFLILLFLGSTIAARRGGHAMRGVLIAGWLVLAAGVVVTTEWYFRGDRKTSGRGDSDALPQARIVLPIAEQMGRLGVGEALMIASEAVDGPPVWAPDGRYLAASVDGKWIGVEPDSVELVRGVWHGGEPIGTVASVNARVPLNTSTVEEWRRHSRSDPRAITTRGGTRLELRRSGAGTEFVVTPVGSAAKIRWTTSSESCHGLALSPDDRFVAFVCEQNGVIVATF